MMKKNPPTLVFTMFCNQDHDHVEMWRGEWEVVCIWDAVFERPYVVKSIKPLTDQSLCWKNIAQIGKSLPNPSARNRNKNNEVCYILEGDDDHEHGDDQSHPHKIVSKVQLILDQEYGIPIELVYILKDGTSEVMTDDPQKIATMWMYILERNEQRTKEGKPEVPTVMISKSRSDYEELNN